MTWYHQQIITLRANVYPKAWLCDQVIGAKLFIDRHFANDICLDAIAAEAHFSKFHFIRLFSTLYGRTPHQYLVEVRIKNARQFLKTGMPVSDVCFAVGFSSTTTFTGLFKKFTGLTPSAFAVLQKSNFEEARFAAMNFLCSSSKQ